jgi:hypothetical protein
MLRHDRQIFRLEYDSFTEAPLRALLSFVKFAKPLVKRSKKQAADMGPNCRAITDYFHYVLPDFPPHVVAVEKTPHSVGARLDPRPSARAVLLFPSPSWAPGSAQLLLQEFVCSLPHTVVRLLGWLFGSLINNRYTCFVFP